MQAFEVTQARPEIALVRSPDQLGISDCGILIATTARDALYRPILIVTLFIRHSHLGISYTLLLALGSAEPPRMCSQECFGNQHRGCGHYVVLYYSGERTDCRRPDCGLSSAHMHKTARNCLCPKVYNDQRRVLNLIQEACDACKEAAFAARVRNRW
ncbi:hypothetical protein AcV5_008556 [Taiwanofungus camphoratus]|nr:hypothetical protein AcV5_008556 [Antrodia cinnamomea]